MDLPGFRIFALGAGYMLGQMKGIWGGHGRMARQGAAGFMGERTERLVSVWRWQAFGTASVPPWMPALLCLLVLLLDLSTPLGVAAGVAYIPLVFCCLWFTRPYTAFVFAGIATALMAIAYFAKLTDADSSMALINRFLTIGAVWFVAALVSIRHRSEQTLRRSEDKLNAVVDHAVDALISIDEQGIIEHFNPASQRIFGYQPVEVLGRNIEMLMSEPQHTGQRGDLLRYFSARQGHLTGVAGCVVSAKRKDGSVFPMDLALSAFRLKDGRHLPGILRDISARKQVEERRALLAAIVASSDDAIISETLEGIITSWNVSAERLLGYSAEETIGKPVTLIVPPEKLEEERDILERLSRGEEIHRLETMRLHKNEQRISVSLTISPVRNTTGRIIGTSKIMRDISTQKKAEADLLHYTRELERSNQELDDFAYIASHDLKEPLRGLFNNSTFLYEDYQDKLDAQGIKRLHRLRYLSQRMEQLVNDLLYFSRLGRQELAIRPTDLNAAIRDIESMMETTLRERNATVVVPRPLPEIVGDKTGVTEIFRNLITNAVKYNDNEAKTVEIGCIDEMRTKNGIEKQVFYVRDNGIGIDEEFHEDIFRIFKRLNEEDDNKKGTGVGLTFVRKIIDRHHGRIWLESTPGKGTTFYFTLAPSIADVAA
jgi:two-component system sensor kinase FixL